MKKMFFSALLMLASFSLYAADVTGTWYGVLKVQGIQLRIVFHISRNGAVYTTTMDSPDQGAKGIPVTTTVFTDPVLKLEVPSARIEYEGTLGNDAITGTFKQGGLSVPMNLGRNASEEPKKLVRPQDPVKPYAYLSEEVSFKNEEAGITLAGTLTLPEKSGPFPAAVLISGSGPQNRDGEVLGHRPFLVLADHLTKNGIAVLRFDDRGTAASGGNFATATSQDFATDVTAAVNYLKTRKEIDKKKIGLIGHSEGGMIAPMVAVRSKDIHFIVLAAGPGLRGDKMLLLQQQLIGKSAGASAADLARTEADNAKIFDMVQRTMDEEKLKKNIADYIRNTEDPYKDKPAEMSEEEYVSVTVNRIVNPWMLYMLRYDPASVLEKVKCPVLAINGSNDLQVAPKENLDAIRAALAKGGNKKVFIEELPGLNHLLQESPTGSPSEYKVIEQTMSPVALNAMVNWIQEQVKK
ncbi:MAG: alpha/beta fold hydrolase [Chitinophagaceae bacterium]|nr:alpha/beta fold hydrolase [Chitinophagaceae bacterium]